MRGIINIGMIALALCQCVCWRLWLRNPLNLVRNPSDGHSLHWACSELTSTYPITAAIFLWYRLLPVMDHITWSCIRYTCPSGGLHRILTLDAEMDSTSQSEVTSYELLAFADGGSNASLTSRIGVLHLRSFIFLPYAGASQRLLVLNSFGHISFQVGSRRSRPADVYAETGIVAASAASFSSPETDSALWFVYFGIWGSFVLEPAEESAVRGRKRVWILTDFWGGAGDQTIYGVLAMPVYEIISKSSHDISIIRELLDTLAILIDHSWCVEALDLAQNGWMCSRMWSVINLLYRGSVKCIMPAEN